MNSNLRLRLVACAAMGALALTATAAHAQATYQYRKFVPTLAVATAIMNLSPQSLPSGRKGMTLTPVNFASWLSVTNDASYTPAQVAWSVASGRLPAGLTLSSTGVLSGVPQEEGTFTFTIRAKFKASEARQTYTLNLATDMLSTSWGYYGNPGGGARYLAMTAAYTSFGSVTKGTTVDKGVHLMNDAREGVIRSAFRLEGDTEHFVLAAAPSIGYYDGAYGTWQATSCGSTLAADKLSATLCTDTSFYTMRNVLRYAPKSKGSHSVTLVPVAGALTQTPAPLQFTGVSLFDAQGRWTIDGSLTTAPTVAQTDFGTRLANSGLADRAFVMSNIGTYGTLKTRFVLSGDVNHFDILGVETGYWNFAGYWQAASCGATVLNFGEETSACTANLMRIVVRYRPTATGSHTVSLTAVDADAETIMPAPLTLTGTAN